MRGILARKEVEKLRQKEMEFLGMIRKKKTFDEEQNDPIDQMMKINEKRKIEQETHRKNYLNDKEKLMSEIKINEGVDM